MSEPIEFYNDCGCCAGCDESCPDYDPNWILQGTCMTDDEYIEVKNILH